MDSAAYSSLGLDAGDAVSDRTAPTLARLLEGTDGLLAGWAGALWVAVVTLAARLYEVPFLHHGFRDVVTHAAAEVAAGACVWTIVWLLLHAFDAGLDATTHDERVRARVAHGLSVVLGAALGVAICWLVVRYSSRWPWLSPATWWTVSAACGVVVAFAWRFALGFTPGRGSRIVGTVFLLGIVVPQVYGLDHYVRHYGRLLGLIQLGILIVAAAGARLLAVGMATRRSVRWALGFPVVAALLWLGLSTPSYSSRRAVLVWGGVAKHFTLDLLWPITDRDGDGVPTLFWGTDPDDRNRRVTPVPKALPGAPASAHPPLAAVPSPPRELLWVLVDTVRRDTFERLRAEDPKVGSAFSSFSYYANYESCSTRTDQVVAQVLGSSRCDPRLLPGGTSLLEALRGAGYEDHGFRYYPIPLDLKRDLVIRNDKKLLDRAKLALAEPRGKPRLLFVHLRGGHNEYDGPGISARERYDGQVARVLRGVGELVQAAPPERYTVVVMGDHGEAFGEHMSVAHANMLYQEVLETPLLIRSPVSAPGRRTELTSCADVGWDILHGLGLTAEPQPPLGFQYAALDLLPGQFGRSQRESLRSLRIGSMKVIQCPQAGIWELYDLARDPGESRSLGESNPELLAPLRAELQRLQTVCPTPPTSAGPLD